jgi:hypothetical protein
MSTDPVLFLLKAAMRLPRPQIERLAEGLIAALDTLDGDPDLEEDDHSGDPLDLEGEAPADDGAVLMTARPIYGADQTQGPINEREAITEHKVAELDLVRSPTGGWRFRS